MRNQFYMHTLSVMCFRCTSTCNLEKMICFVVVNYSLFYSKCMNCQFGIFRPRMFARESGYKVPVIDYYSCLNVCMKSIKLKWCKLWDFINVPLLMPEWQSVYIVVQCTLQSLWHSYIMLPSYNDTRPQDNGHYFLCFDFPDQKIASRSLKYKMFWQK